MAGKKDVQDLSDWELLNELKSLGMKVGPISPTTRRIYEKKLSKVRGYDVVDNTREDLNTRADVLANESTKLTNAVVIIVLRELWKVLPFFMVSVLTWFVRLLKVDYQLRPCL